MTGGFAAGQNTPLTSRAVRFTATASVPLDLCAFVVDDRLRVASSTDVVFYNQPSTTGVRLESGAIIVEVDALPAGSRVLCAIAGEQPAAVSASLADVSGVSLAMFHVEPTAPALLCWEIYRRGDGWKIRALGMGYEDGMLEMFVAHGVEVDDEPQPVEAPAPAPAPAPVPVSGVSAVHSPLDLLWRIFEDAARSAAAYTSAQEFAQHRLDDDLSAAVADPATRTGTAGDRARAHAQSRYDRLVDDAKARYRDDSAVLAAELVTVDATLPPGVASWMSQSWSQPSAPSDGIRVGELSMPDVGALGIPFCLPAPLPRALWFEGESGDYASVVSAVALRLLSAQPGALVHVIDPDGVLSALTQLVTRVLAGPPVHDAQLVGARLKGLADAVDLDDMARRAGTGSPVAPLVVVIAGVSPSYPQEDLLQILRLMKSTYSQPISILIGGVPVSRDDEPILRLLQEEAKLLPADDGHRLPDPWTGNHWTFTPDRLPTDAALLRTVAEGPALQH